MQMIQILRNIGMVNIFNYCLIKKGYFDDN